MNDIKIRVKELAKSKSLKVVKIMNNHYCAGKANKSEMTIECLEEAICLLNNKISDMEKDLKNKRTVKKMDEVKIVKNAAKSLQAVVLKLAELEEKTGVEFIRPVMKHNNNNLGWHYKTKCGKEKVEIQ
jgi:hypothetical protein